MRPVQSEEVRAVHTMEGLGRLVEALTALEMPFECVIRPCTSDRATQKQRGLWAAWMRELENRAGQPRRQIELALLKQFGRMTPCNGNIRPKELAELSAEEASAVMTQVQIAAAEADIHLSSRS